MNINKLLLYAVLLLSFSSCKFYRNEIMFQTDKSVNEEALKSALLKAESGYRLRKGDVISFQLYTNKGEVMIDPNSDLARQLGSGKMTSAQGGEGSFTRQDRNSSNAVYLIDNTGHLFLPMIGKLYVDSLTQNQFDSILVAKYASFYQDPFIISKIDSKKIVVLNGLKSRVITLGSMNINLIEALAMLEGVEEYSNMKKIRLIRGDLKNPSVQLIDLSTIDGMRKADLMLLPDDIVYIEPGRIPAREIGKDFIPYASLFISIIYITALLLR